MATSLDFSLDLSSMVLDLDDVKNIVHPCWELLRPNPDIVQLFDYFNDTFFRGILRHRVILDWIEMDGEDAGQSKHIEANNRIKIDLNKKLLRIHSRKSIIEILLHEMIHAYLMHTHNEDKKEDNHHHGKNFITKMVEINKLARIDITANHTFCTGMAKKCSKRTEVESDNETDNQKYHMWRCRGYCRNMVPYFGFIWIKEEDREPCVADTMWIATDECAHNFEKFGDDDPKEWLTEWECIIKFNEFVSENNIQIKCNEICARNDGAFAIDIVETDIANKLYINFHRDSKQFMNMVEFLAINLIGDVDSLQQTRTACMICWSLVKDEDIIEHLKQCSGVEFSLDSEEALPIVKIVT